MKITLIRQQEHWMKRWLWAIFSFIRSTTHKENCWTWNQLRVVDDIFIKLCPLPQESEKYSSLPSLSPPPPPYAMSKEESHFGDICVPTWRAKTVELTISMNFFEVALSSQFKQGTFITNSDLYKPLLHFSVHISCNFTNCNNSEVCSRLGTDKCPISTSVKTTPSVKASQKRKFIHSPH